MCPECTSLTPGPNFCGTCAAPIRKLRTPSHHARLLRQTGQQRYSELEAQFTPPSDPKRQAMFDALMLFMREDGLPEPSIYDVTPRDVVAFMLAKDSKVHGQTVVHTDDCPDWGTKLTRCKCPRRMSYYTLRQYRYALQKYFIVNGLTDQWSPTSGTGNPLKSPFVDRYLTLIESEQCAAGVAQLQAALIDTSLYEAILRDTLSEWLEARHDHDDLSAIQYLRDALYYAMLWNTGLRAGDALRLMAGSITLFDATAAHPHGGVYIRLHKTKRGVSLDDPHRITVPCDGTRYSLKRLVQLFMSVTHSVMDTELVGPLFRKYQRTADAVVVASTRATWDEMDRRFKLTLERVSPGSNLLRQVTMHSFHGSRAAREALAGIPRAETCAAMRWSEQMYDYYTQGREPLTIDGVRFTTSTRDRDLDDEAETSPFLQGHDYAES